MPCLKRRGQRPSARDFDRQVAVDPRDSNGDPTFEFRLLVTEVSDPVDIRPTESRYETALVLTGPERQTVRVDLGGALDLEPGETYAIVLDAYADFDGIQGNAGVVADLQGDLIRGVAGADQISGLSGADVIEGGSCDDAIGGDEGDDLQTGGAGADTFVFSAGFGQGTIADFESGDVLAFPIGIGEAETVADVLAALTATPEGLVHDVAGDGADALLLQGLAAGDVTAAHIAVP